MVLMDTEQTQLLIVYHNKIMSLSCTIFKI